MPNLEIVDWREFQPTTLEIGGRIREAEFVKLCKLLEDETDPPDDDNGRLGHFRKGTIWPQSQVWRTDNMVPDLSEKGTAGRLSKTLARLRELGMSYRIWTSDHGYDGGTFEEIGLGLPWQLESFFAGNQSRHQASEIESIWYPALTYQELQRIHRSGKPLDQLVDEASEVEEHFELLPHENRSWRCTGELWWSGRNPVPRDKTDHRIVGHNYDKVAIFDLPVTHPLHIAEEYRAPALGYRTLEGYAKAGKSIGDILDEFGIHLEPLPPFELTDPLPATKKGFGASLFQN